MLFSNTGTDYLFLTDIAFHDCRLVDCKVLNQELISLCRFLKRYQMHRTNQDTCSTYFKKTYQIFHERLNRMDGKSLSGIS